ncbi:MAG: (deoxy)nucleoside triphosphate pyrophosphohydrolase [Armatimonadota bacterium]
MSSSQPVEVALALIWRDGCLLVTRRPQNVHLGGFWEFPGGKCLPGEAPEACAEREALEEVGVRCRARDRRSPLRFTYPERSVVLYPIDCDYICGPPQALQVAEWRWVPAAELKDLSFPPANQPLMDELAGF